jgi:hypothetical protein
MILFISVSTLYPLFIPKKEPLKQWLHKGKTKTIELLQKSKSALIYCNPTNIEDPLRKNFFSGITMGTITHLITQNNQSALHVGLDQGAFILLNIDNLNLNEIEKLKEQIKWFFIYTSGIIAGEALGSLLCSYIKALLK